MPCVCECECEYVLVCSGGIIERVHERKGCMGDLGRRWKKMEEDGRRWTCVPRLGTHEPDSVHACVRRIIDKIDVVLISHPDLAHMGALPYICGKLGSDARMMIDDD